MDITSANAVLMMSSFDAGIVVAQQIQEFAVDDAFDFDDVTPTEVQMGLDGVLAAGFVYVPKPMTITLLAGSASNDFFEAINSAQNVGVGAVSMEGVLTLTSVRKSYTLITGYLTRYHPVADGKRVLQPRKYQVTWRQILRTTIGPAG